MKTVLFTFVCCLLFQTTYSQTKYTPSPENIVARRWFEEARFGMFVHFGVYSVLAHNEWIMHNESIKVKDYKRLINVFNPQDFDAAAWVSIAKNAGMKYITFTSRHHEGFSNWDTKQSDWKITKTHYSKDLIRQLSAECQKQGIKLFLYYSLVDWARDDYQWQTGRTGKGTGRTGPSNWPAYIEFMKAQLTELLTEYGPIGGIWFDGHWDQTAHENRTDHTTAVNWHYDEIYGLIHRLQPACLIANNHHLPPIEGEDYQIFEHDLPGENKAGLSGQEVSDRLPLETCTTINGSWCYNILDTKYKSKEELVHLLVRSAGYGGNLLLDVGPMANGEIQPEFVERLGQIGEWIKTNGTTIYGTKGGFIRPQEWGAVTQKGNIIYVHIFDKKDMSQLKLDIPGKIKDIRLFNTIQKIVWKQDKKTLQTVIDLNFSFDEIDTILEVELKK